MTKLTGDFIVPGMNFVAEINRLNGSFGISHIFYFVADSKSGRRYQNIEKEFFHLSTGPGKVRGIQLTAGNHLKNTAIEKRTNEIPVKARERAFQVIVNKFPPSENSGMTIKKQFSQIPVQLKKAITDSPITESLIFLKIRPKNGISATKRNIRIKIFPKFPLILLFNGSVRCERLPYQIRMA